MPTMNLSHQDIEDLHFACLQTHDTLVDGDEELTHGKVQQALRFTFLSERLAEYMTPDDEDCDDCGFPHTGMCKHDLEEDSDA